MGQKVHPLGFRLSISQDHQSQWYANTTDYSTYVLEDIYIRQRLLQKFSDAGIIKIQIERKVDLIKISMIATQPRAFSSFSLLQSVNTSKQISSKVDKNGIENKLTKADSGNFTKNRSFDKETNPLNLLRDDLTQAIVAYRKKSLAFKKPRTLRNTLFFGQPEIEIYIEKLTAPFTSAVFVADAISLEIEKRIPFRRAMKYAIQRAQKAGVQGIKVQISGRLNGAEIARSEWVRKGRIPLHTLRAKIDYTCQTAKTIYGIIGIKVWVFEGMSETLTP